MSRTFTDLFKAAWRVYESDGAPASGPHEPSKADIWNLGVKLDAVFAVFNQGLAAAARKSRAGISA